MILKIWKYVIFLSSEWVAQRNKFIKNLQISQQSKDALNWKLKNEFKNVKPIDHSYLKLSKLAAFTV